MIKDVEGYKSCQHLFLLYRKREVSYKVKNAPRGCASRGEEVSCKQHRSSAKESQATLCSLTRLGCQKTRVSNFCHNKIEKEEQYLLKSISWINPSLPKRYCQNDIFRV